MSGTFGITGATRVFAVLADPIGQVKSPEAVNRLFSERGDDCVLVPFHVTVDDLASVIEGLRGVRSLGGFVVTVPHKEAALAQCDSLSAAAAQIGAVNVVTRDADGRLHGHNLDGHGFVAGLRLRDIDPAGLAVYLMGAGGGASAIAHALAQAGVGSITLHNRTPARAEQLAMSLRDGFPELTVRLGSDDPAGHDLVINATSLGMRADDPLPCDASRLTADQIVSDIVMLPAQTALLGHAARQGCRVHPGRWMLEGQIELIYQTLKAH